MKKHVIENRRHRDETLELPKFKEQRKRVRRTIKREGGFPGGASGKESACQHRRHKRYQFVLWVGTTPWSRKLQVAPVLLPGKCHGQKSLAGYSSWAHIKIDMTKHMHMQER